jgi:hypothetical protein
MENRFIKHCRFPIILAACIIQLIASCKKDNNNNSGPALGSAGPLTYMPTSGDAGTLVTINGSGFSTTTSDDIITFDGAQANVVSASETQLVVQAPQSGSTGNLEVSVNGKKVTAGTYTYQTLSIHSVTPVNGPTGTNVMISGAGFGSTTSQPQVTINGKTAIVTSVTDTLLVAAVPANAGTGVVIVTVNGKTATGPVFTYQAINAITPSSGGAGTIVTVHGTGFSKTATQNVVAFNGVVAMVTSANDSLIVATAPAGVATGPVSVSINGERTVGPVFTVVPPPLLTTLTPGSGPAGTMVAIAGNYFSTVIGQNQVSFNGITAKVDSAFATRLVVTVPAGAITGKIAVTTNNQQSTGPVFTVQSLGVSALAPNNGLDGTVVTITGTGFSTNPAQDIVTFTGTATPATVTVATVTQLTVTVPTGSASGVVTVKVNGLMATGPYFTHAGVITLAGGPNTGLIDDFPSSIAVDPSGNVYVSDNNHIIKITPSGATSIIGSSTGAGGYQDGSAADALFSNPENMTTDNQGNVYVADNSNMAIREISPSGVVSTYKKLAFAPAAIEFDSQGLLYVSANTGVIYKYLANGLVSTLTSQASSIQFAIDATGNVYFGTPSYGTNLLYKIDASTGATTTFAGSLYRAGFVDGGYGTGEWNSIGNFMVDPTTQNLIVPDSYGTNAIRQVSPGGVIKTITGGGNFTGQGGHVDGPLATALFNVPLAVAVGKTGLIYVLERSNEDVREIATH